MEPVHNPSTTFADEACFSTEEGKTDVRCLDGLNTELVIPIRIKHATGIKIDHNCLRNLSIDKLKNSEIAKEYANIEKIDFDFERCIVNNISIYGMKDYSHDDKSTKVHDAFMIITQPQELMNKYRLLLQNETALREIKDKFPLCLTDNDNEVVIFHNADSVDTKHRQVADANLMYLADNQEASFDKLGKYRSKPYVFKSQLPDMTERAVISKSAEETIDMLDYACKSDLFEFGDISKTEFITWKDNDLYTDKDGFKYMPWKLFSKIKKTYKELRAEYTYTKNLGNIDIGFTDDNDASTPLDCSFSLKISLFLPLSDKDFPGQDHDGTD